MNIEEILEVVRRSLDTGEAISYMFSDDGTVTIIYDDGDEIINAVLSTQQQENVEETLDRLWKMEVDDDGEYADLEDFVVNMFWEVVLDEDSELDYDYDLEDFWDDDED